MEPIAKWPRTKDKHYTSTPIKTYIVCVASVAYGPLIKVTTLYWTRNEAEREDGNLVLYTTEGVDLIKKEWNACVCALVLYLF